MSDVLVPLNQEQFERLPDDLRKGHPVRFLVDGRAVNITTGTKSSLGSNIIYHPVYWDRTPGWVKAVKGFLEENNPGIVVRVTHH